MPETILYYNTETKVVFASSDPQTDMAVHTIKPEDIAGLKADGATVDTSADSFDPVAYPADATPINGTVSTPETPALPAAPETASTDPQDEGAVTTTGATNAAPDDGVAAADAASAADVAAGDKISGATTPETNPSGVTGASVRTEIDGDKPSPATGVVKATGLVGDTAPTDAPADEAPENKDDPEGWLAKIIRIAEHEGGEAMAKIREYAHKVRAAL